MMKFVSFLLLFILSFSEQTTGYVTGYVFVGDSVLSSYDSRLVSAHGDEKHRPVTLTTNNIVSQFYDKFPGQHANYHRIDSDYFVRSGDWTTDTIHVPGVNAFSLRGHEKARFDFVSDTPLVQLAYWRSLSGGEITISLSCDTGYTVPGSCTEIKHVSANSSLHSEYAEYEFMVAPGSKVSVSITGDVYVWGVIELTQGGITVANLARGGHNLDELYAFADSDISPRLHRGYTFIIQIPLMNMINDRWGAIHIMESTKKYLDLLVGESVFVIIPYYRSSQLQGDIPDKMVKDAYDTALVVASNYNYQIIDMRDMASKYASLTGLDTQSALKGSKWDGPTLTADGSHPNDHGSDVFSSELIKRMIPQQFLSNIRSN